MFTGLIEEISVVKSLTRITAGKLVVTCEKIAGEVTVGDSVSVSSVCLTVTSVGGGELCFDAVPETLARSALSDLRPGDKVNLETSVRAGEMMGGHFVQGHIDGTAAIKTIERQGRFTKIMFSADTELLEQMVVKGSVAVDGISLTIADLDSKSFTIVLIPQTLNETTIGQAKTGDVVNIETDIIVKAVRKQLENVVPQKKNLSIEKLKELGF